MARRRQLRPGYTTGACAAAAAKAAAGLLLLGDRSRSVDIALAEGQRVVFRLKAKRMAAQVAFASVIKDAGDDPDVTNGAEICAEVSLSHGKAAITVTGGSGVGTVTRPGLPVRQGRAAINPVPMKMIRAALREVVKAHGGAVSIKAIISVTDGERLAGKTLNPRLGIVGGLSILGTTGIVKPLSCDAWRETIKVQINVALASGLDYIVLCSGRTSERYHMKAHAMPVEAYIMSGDHVEWSLQEARRQGVGRIYLAAQWAKMIKVAMGTPDTHVRAGVINPAQSAVYLRSIGIRLPDKDYNTAREMFHSLMHPHSDIPLLLREATRYASGISGAEVRAALVAYDGEVIEGDG